MRKETVDVLMGGYLSKDAARDDFEAVQACGAPLLGIVVVSKGLDGTMEIEQHDHIVKEGAEVVGGAGFIVGLLAPPLLVATAVGVVIGAGVGKIAHKKVESALEAQAEQTIPIGGAGTDRRLRPQARRGHRGRRDASHQEGRRRGDRQPRQGRQGRAGRRVGEDGCRGLTASEPRRPRAGTRPLRLRHTLPVRSTRDRQPGASSTQSSSAQSTS